ncbi:uncharacterized protein ACNS7B_003491 isoform 2-T2 [Menidia menidia]
MFSEAPLRISWICVLLFGIGTCFPPLKSQTSGSSGGGEASGTGYMSGGTSGYGSGASGSVSGYTSGAAYSSSGPGFGFSGNSGGFGSGASSSGGSGFGSGGGSSARSTISTQDADLARFFAALMSLKVDGSSPQSAWSSNQVPLTMAEVQSSYPVSHSVLYNGGYKRARDSSSFAKYSQDAFEDGADTQSKTGSKGQKFY